MPFLGCPPMLTPPDTFAGRLPEWIASWRFGRHALQDFTQTVRKDFPPKIRARQIAGSDVPAVVDLLTEGFPRRGRRYWQQALQRLGKHPTPPTYPKYGYLLETNGRIVGAVLLIFTATGSGADRITWCNVSGWYVEAAFRAYATMLTYPALSSKDVTYLNISPAKHVRPIIEVQGFRRYADGQFLALPILSRSPERTKVRILGGAQCPEVPFDPLDRELLRSHMEFGCIGLWCVTPERAYPFLFVPRLVRRVVSCAQLIYCPAIEDLVRFAQPIGRFLTLRGRPLVLIDSNGPIAGLVGYYFAGHSPKYFRGANRPRLGDLTYTEAAIFGI